MEQALALMLTHFWENRQLARAHFSGRAGEDAQRLLADMVETRLEGERLTIPNRLAAQQMAAAALMPVRAWLFGAASSSPADLAAGLCRAGQALIAALREP